MDGKLKLQIYNCHTINDISIRQQFEKKYNIKLKYNLWYQPETKSYFGIDFLRRNVGDLNSIFKQNIIEFRTKYKNLDIVSDEWAYEYNDVIESFRNKKILILGAGPSTNLINWDVMDYDHIISGNTCYLNQKIYDSKLSLFYINVNHAYPMKKRLDSYLDKNKPLIVYSGQNHNLNMVDKSYKKKIFTGLRCNSKVGIMPRLILFMVAWEAKEVNILGMDGYTSCTTKSDYAFSTKNMSGLVDMKMAGSIGERFNEWNNITWAWERQYIMVFDYIINYLKSKTKLINLGESVPSNMLNNISEVMFK